MARYTFDDYRKEQQETWSAAWYLLLFALFAGCPVFLIYQTVQWLKLGVWPALTIRTWLEWADVEIPRLTWVGAQRLFDLGLGVPLWLACPVLGGLLFYLTLALTDRLQRRAGKSSN